jgi:DNA mismatch endonuclease (patch repair protein)
MTDIVDRTTRSRIMSRIRSRDTRIEVLLRRALFARGFRYRLHGTCVVGHPDMYLPKYRAAIFVHGCYWHGHDCTLFRLPSTNTDFWRQKIGRNRERDRSVIMALSSAGTRVMTVWECSIRGKGPEAVGLVADRLADWLRSGQPTGEIRG